MELYYLNSRGEKLDFTKFPYLIKDVEELLDFSRDYDIDNDKITFSEEPAEVSLVLNVSAETHEAQSAAIDRFYDVTEYDINRNAFGRLYYGKQYIECYLIGSQKKDWCLGVDYLMSYIRLVTLRQAWITEEHYQFLPAERQKDSEGADYPLDFPIDYKGATKGSGHINNSRNMECDFKMLVYGPCMYPRITIANHAYEVMTKLDAGEYMIVDSKAGTVNRIRTNGAPVNEFNNRNKKESVFTRIPSGNNLVSWDGTFGFDITLFYERGEPKWS